MSGVVLAAGEANVRLLSFSTSVLAGGGGRGDLLFDQATVVAVFRRQVRFQGAAEHLIYT